ncbi:MAG: NfeD family protein [Clostridia bacterium]|nr:NfeD family protein [Clostridia bacterium]
MWKLWVISAGLFLILESITTGFLVFWFAIGSIVSMIISFFTDNIIVQTSAFLISSIILIFATRKFCNFFLKNAKPKYVNTMVGKTGKVTVDIVPIDGTGQVKIGGETWSAISKDSSQISKDTEIVVKEVDGVKVVVMPK